MYKTKNTLVAAALVTLGRVKMGVARDNGSVVWELDSGEANGEQDVAVAFNKKDYNREPLAAMVRVANARDWLLHNVVYGNYEIAADSDSFITRSLVIASCLIADRYYLRAFRDGEFFFAPGARVYSEKFNERPDGDAILDWQRRYLAELAVMIHEAKGLRNGA
jgi:hypothetical protein